VVVQEAVGSRMQARCGVLCDVMVQQDKVVVSFALLDKAIKQCGT
jgi:hypothetical protein